MKSSHHSYTQDARAAGAPNSQGARGGAAPPADPSPPVLLERRVVTGELLRLKLSRPAGFDYRAGQHVKMGTSEMLRDYSLVSAPHEHLLEFFVELIPGGRLSERLRSVAPGAVMALGSRAKGDLRLDATRTTQFMIATVTGIAPYLSLLRDHLHRAPGQGAAAHRFIILHGASFADELGYLAELTALAQRHPQRIVYLPTVSRPEHPRNRGWSGERGRVETLIDPIIARFRLSPHSTAVFACGNPEMVRNVAAASRKRAFTTYVEPFD
ncbi:MAG: FAD-binding oxidoreductase [Pseudomonadales bacterium]